MFIRKKNFQKLVNSLYEAAELVLKQQRLIEKLNEENRRLEKDLTDLQDFCMNFAVDHKDIDFPNSKKGGIEDSNIFT